MTEIYLSKNHLLLQSGYGDPDIHRHSACHILAGLDGDIHIRADGENWTCRGALIPSGMQHTVKETDTPVLVFLFDSTTTVSEQISRFRTLDADAAEQIVSAYRRRVQGGCLEEAYGDYLSEVLALAGIGAVGSRITDERLIWAMEFVEEHLADQISVGDAARAACLSESRFSHLFKEQVGITFAGYAVQRRLYRAYIELSKGASVTDAALSAGFSSPSHFATVNKKTFGITAREICGDFRLHEIADF